MKAPRHKRTAAQAAAAKNFAAAGRAAQARKRAYNKAHGLPTRTAKQTQASIKAAAAGRAAQARKRAHLKPLPRKTSAMSRDDGVGVGVAGVESGGSGFGEGFATRPVLYQPGAACVATAIANHLLIFTGVTASEREILDLHYAAGGDDDHGVVIADMLDVLMVRGLAGVQVESFWPVAGRDDLPGFVTRLRLPQGAHTVLTLGGNACASWGSTRPAPGYAEESWWIQWA